MSNYSMCQEELVELSIKQGYLTFDDILNKSEIFSLSVSEVDFLSEAIQLRGIIVYEHDPQVGKSLQENDDILDYSHTDYTAIFNEIIDLAPQLATLIMHVKYFPTPQWGEADQLARQIAEGNQFAKERTVMLYTRNVLKIALSMTKQYELDIEDAISAGFIGLMNAIERYNPSGFSSFLSFASIYIQQSIQRECSPVWMSYYFPSHYKYKIFQILPVYNHFNANNCETSYEYKQLLHHITEETALSEDDVNNALANIFMQKYGKLNIDTIIQSESSTYGYMMSGHIISEDDMFEVVFQKDLKRIINELLSSLSERESLVIRMRNGIGYSAPMTLEEIGLQLKLTRERIRQIESIALRKLSQKSCRKLLYGYIIA